MDFDVSHIQQSEIEELIKLWHNHVLLNCLCDTGKVKFKDMMFHIQSLLQAKKPSGNINNLLLKGKDGKDGKDTNYMSQWRKKMERLVDEKSSSETKKKQSTALLKVFGVILPIINDHLDNPDGKDIKYQKKEWVIIKLYSGAEKSNDVKRIGNYTLATKKQRDAKKSYEALLANLKEKENGFAINKGAYLKKDFGSNDCEDRTTKLLDVIKEILGEEEK